MADTGIVSGIETISFPDKFKISSRGRESNHYLEVRRESHMHTHFRYFLEFTN